MIRRIEKLGYRHSIGTVFEDYVAMMALSISYMVDFTHAKERKEERQRIAKKYNRKELQEFKEIFILFGNEIERHMDAPEDILGPIFEALNLGNSRMGQFFTSTCISRFLGEIQVGSLSENIQEKGFITACDPCVGSGSLPLGLAAAMASNHYDHRLKIVATAVDIDIRCVYMAYVQLSLYGIPGVVIHGDAMSVEQQSRWYTPVYILDQWVWRQRCGLVDRRYLEDELIKCADEPFYGMIRYGFDVFKNPDRAEESIQVEQPEVPLVKFDIELKEDKNGQLKFDL